MLFQLFGIFVCCTNFGSLTLKLCQTRNPTTRPNPIFGPIFPATFKFHFVSY
jgi:hypothetical protein